MSNTKYELDSLTLRDLLIPKHRSVIEYLTQQQISDTIHLRENCITLLSLEKDNTSTTMTATTVTHKEFVDALELPLATLIHEYLILKQTSKDLTDPINHKLNHLLTITKDIERLLKE